LDLEENWQIIEKQIEDNLENGEEYVRLINNPPPISEFDVGQMSSGNIGKTYKA